MSLFVIIMKSNLAYCSSPIPAQPIRASNTTKETLDIPGQVVTYTCDLGFEFVGDPVKYTAALPTTTTSTTTTTTTTTTLVPTTTVSMNWKTFKGAQYAIGEESNANKVTWTEAQAKCQSAGANLASIHTQEIKKWISTEFYTTYGDAWVGGSDTETEGTYKWVNGVPFVYVFSDTNNCQTTQRDDKDCLYMPYMEYGRTMDRVCTNKLNKYLCQKGVSTSTFWNDIEGKEYAYFEMYDPDCDFDWNFGLRKCEEWGGTLASIPSQSVLDQIKTLFLDDMENPNGVWIGYKKDGGTWKWTDGETSSFENWKSGDPKSGHECTFIKDNGQWRSKACDETYYYKGAICVRGSTEGWAGRRRRRRSTDTAATVREVTCDPLWSDTAGYWNYPYTVPEYCHSKFKWVKNNIKSKFIIFQG